MDLSVSEATFKKNLSKLGYKFSITNYYNMISYLQSHAQSEILLAIKNDTNIEEKIDLIFGLDIDQPILACLYDVEYINYISDKYIIYLFEHEYLNAFLKPIETKPSRSTMLNAYKLSLLNDFSQEITRETVFSLFLTFIKEQTNFFSLIRVSEYTPWYTCFNKSSSSYINALNVSDIDLDDYIKDEIRTEFLNLIFEFLTFQGNNQIYRMNIFQKELQAMQSYLRNNNFN